jgi:hypothetical protein
MPREMCGPDGAVLSRPIIVRASSPSGHTTPHIHLLPAAAPPPYSSLEIKVASQKASPVSTISSWSPILSLIDTVLRRLNM